MSIYFYFLLLQKLLFTLITIQMFLIRPLRCFLVILLVSFSGFSCINDHEIPVKVPAKIKTVEMIFAFPSTFKLQFEDLGNIPVTEYGILLSKGISGFLTPVPTFADEVFIFTSPVDLSVKSQVYVTSTSYADVNYRAYAKLEDGTIVYGEVLKYRFQPG